MIPMPDFKAMLEEAKAEGRFCKCKRDKKLDHAAIAKLMGATSVCLDCGGLIYVPPEEKEPTKE